jgi:hypothetical protein
MSLQELIGALFLLSLVAPTQASEQGQTEAKASRSMSELQESHIAANAPPEANFIALLQRDVRAYLAGHGLPSEILKIEALRQGATQSGVSLPKYYIWIRATDETGHIAEGAMRVAAIEQVEFEITHFTPADSIRSDPSSLASIYPVALIPAIRKHAGVE